MIAAVKHNLGNLTNFNGRDGRPTFWWYVLFLVVAQYLVGIVATIPMMAGVMTTAFDAAQAGVDQTQMQETMFAGMADSMRSVMWVGVVTSIVCALLILASFVRRLHDSGKSGYWAIIPMVTQAVAMYFSVQMMGQIDEIFAAASDPEQMQQIQREMMIQGGGFVGYIGYLFVIVMGVLKSDEGPNQYGDAPVSLS
ncbi:DUF805 domain-containing protein [Aurantiacibacter sp. D1-12]|uniref:DUF805 domain-containing protein n=1 Tax=Aurantiacibacter sp. D1-12 TaxID=2993658 RepID=UPI00237D18DB|nr:DUF805 domain-containing protein [Aurantiacibacter sp. D1-12]MDE1466736.1 DUF805 domain-containing protein [Aurantiacibacter sp. D1-12]